MNILSLPSDVLIYIAKHVNPKTEWSDMYIGTRDIVYFSFTCKRLYHILNNEILWKDFYQRDLSAILPTKIKNKYLKSLQLLATEDENEVAAERGFEKIIFQMNPDEIKRNMIFMALENEHFTIFEYLYKLLKEKETKEFEDEIDIDQETVIEIVNIGKLSLFKYLEDKNFPYNPIDCLYIATRNGHVELTKYLLGKVDGLDITLLLYNASSSNNLELIEFLINDHLKQNKQLIDNVIFHTSSCDIVTYFWPYSSKNPEKLIGLIRSDEMIEINKIKLAIKLGFDIHWNNELLLMTQIINGKLNNVKWLIDNGAKVNIEIKEGGRGEQKTPLSCAYLNGETEIFNYLIEKGADIKTQWNERGKHICKQFYPETHKVYLKAKREQKKMDNKNIKCDKGKRPYTLSTGNKCLATTAKGDRCKRPPQYKGYCRQHQHLVGV